MFLYTDVTVDEYLIWRYEVQCIELRKTQKTGCHDYTLYPLVQNLNILNLVAVWIHMNELVTCPLFIIIIL